MIIKYGWWSENFLINIPAIFCCPECFNLQKKLSINVALNLLNLVGKVIWGYRLCDINKSKNLL